QSILRNPLAEPYLLGVSSGASLAAYLWRFPAVGAALASALGTFAAAISQQAFAFAGALSAVAVVFALASRRGRVEPVTLLLVGVIVNSINGSIYLLINALAKDMTGGSGGEIACLVGVIQTNLEPAQVVAAAAVVGTGWLVLSYLSGQLNAAVLSEAEAEALGVRIHRLRWAALVTASLMTASAVAVSGPIGFVGLVAPHVARLLVGHDQRRLLPVATALGAGGGWRGGCSGHGMTHIATGAEDDFSDSIAQKVIDIVVERAHADRTEVTPEARLFDLTDSLGVTEIVMDLEDEFEGSMPDEA